MDEKQRQRDMYAHEETLWNEKIHRLRKERVIETDPVVQFRLEQDLAVAIEQHGQLLQEMENWEAQVADPDTHRVPLWSERIRSLRIRLIVETNPQVLLQLEHDLAEALANAGRPNREGRHVPPLIWNVPFARNPFFTGREELLDRLFLQLQTMQTAALSQPQAISGLGGIGKTQLAIEYAYRYEQEYQSILWARADTTEALNASYTDIARVLDMPQKDAQEQEVIVQAVKDWLKRNKGWLLILDNADDLKLVQPFLPPSSSGHLLLTTRAQIIGKLARRFEVETLDRDAGAWLLLRRAGLIAPEAVLETASPSDRTIANTLTEELGGLPLALDQAGAYIEEAQCSLAEYQQQYQTRRAELLAFRGGLPDEHPEPVATTWSLSFAKVKQANPIAAELLQACAFLAPDAIPEELLMEALKTRLPLSKAQKKQHGRGGWFSWLTPESHQKRKTTPLLKSEGEINKAVAILRAYSLIQRDTREKTVQVHRLVQAVVRDALEEQDQVVWMTRVVCSVNVLFPEVEFGTWKHCARYLPQALACDAWIAQSNLKRLEGASLLHRVGRYLQDRAQYAEAEPLYQRALRIYELALGPDHPSTGNTRRNYASLLAAMKQDDAPSV